LKTVVERHNPQGRLNILETGGTVESLRLLEDGRAQLATAQADVMPGRSAQMVAVLYDDVFQLLAHAGSKMESFPDLRGMRFFGYRLWVIRRSSGWSKAAERGSCGLSKRQP
jgi:TRAP-type uncharacterized transport system substrate-binding protein